jgi:hypothetical protein
VREALQTLVDATTLLDATKRDDDDDDDEGARVDRARDAAIVRALDS